MVPGPLPIVAVAAAVALANLALFGSVDAAFLAAAATLLVGFGCALRWGRA